MVGVTLGVADAASDLIGVVVADLIGVAIGVAGARTGVVWVVVAEEYWFRRLQLVLSCLKFL